MNIRQLATFVATPARCNALKSIIKKKQSYLFGAVGSSAALILSAIPAKEKTPLIVVGNDADDAGYMYYDLCLLLGKDAIAFFPSGFRRDIKYGQADAPAQILRTDALSKIKDASVKIVVTYPEALAESVATRQELSDHSFLLSVGREYDRETLKQWLIDNNFNRVDYVYEPGQFAIRGSIIDIYSFSAELPVRIDFFDNEIDTIRSFAVETQLSEEKLSQVAITANISHSIGKLSLLDFVDPKTIFAFRNEALALARIDEIGNTEMSSSMLLANEGDVDAKDVVIDSKQFAENLSGFNRLHFSAAKSSSKTTNALELDASPQGIYHKNFELICDYFKELLAKEYKIYILSDNERQFDRLREIFRDRGDDIPFIPIEGTLHEGFIDHDNKICVFTDHQIFDRFHKYTLRSERARSGKLAFSLRELTQIELGDYIVHIDHGVGQFGGLIRTKIGEHIQEVIKLVYKDDDVLLVSLHQLHKLAKYRGKEGVPPRINRLGSGAWQRMKDSTKRKLKDIARDLIKLYAARREEVGFAFAPDSYLQHELEASFIYEDTPDQIKATQAVKADMESNRPMDRLICGDVGFGKTEIAIRAAFKAATDSKQVAVLVPTTVLANQHYHTFKDRLAEFPVRVEYLSRARTPKETKQILADLADGKIDIIIGTHKLIGKTVKFKDLGLLIIDEEQKFGVAVKERLKQMKVNVDTLTMSATPIPRTLQFSLMGARDLSTITTPPPNRYPIITSVNALTDDIVVEAINFELSRGGQVFFVNPRIEGLYELQAMVQRLVPDAKTIVAYGQLPPEKLEKAIYDFAAHDYDVLFATTIIESGVDMPNVNTIIINNAQNFGLSELHQLRGRVGRSSRKAFCYLIVPGHIPLTPEARRRLQAIESFSDLGSGIHIAMQDLDIRGAGNLLGAEQSGFIADLGFETYQKILKEAVIELRAEEFPNLAGEDNSTTDSDEYVADCTIESDLEILFPASYIPQEGERIALYKELDSIETDEALSAFEERLRDRFGKIPDTAKELLLVPRLRRLARKAGIEKVLLKQGKMFTYFVDETNRAYYQSPMFGRMLAYLNIYPKRTEIRERSGKRSFVFSNVPSVAEALAILQVIYSLEAI